MSVGIVETQNVLGSVNEVALELIKVFKDGVQVTDFAQVWADFQSNQDLKAKVEAAWAAHSQLPAELGDLDIGEIVSLVITEASYVPRVLAALKA